MFFSFFHCFPLFSIVFHLFLFAFIFFHSFRFFNKILFFIINFFFIFSKKISFCYILIRRNWRWNAFSWWRNSRHVTSRPNRTIGTDPWLNASRMVEPWTSRLSQGQLRREVIGDVGTLFLKALPACENHQSTGWFASTWTTLVADYGKALRLLCLFWINKRAKFSPEYSSKTEIRPSEELTGSWITMADSEQSSLRENTFQMIVGGWTLCLPNAFFYYFSKSNMIKLQKKCF